MGSNRHLRAALAVLFLVSVLVVASCEERAAVVGVDTAPIRAWVGGPMDGSEIPMGANSALCIGFARAGVTQLELRVNGGFANRMANPSPSEQYFTAELAFSAEAAGAYVLECGAFDQDGLTAWSEPVTVYVTGEEPSPTTPSEIPTATPTATEVPPTEVPPTSTSVVPTSTRIPPTSTRIPPTSTPLPPSPTRVPPRITSFEVSKSQITLGECVTFYYEVAGSPDAIFFDGVGVVGPSGSEDRCPTETREFVLTAKVGNQVVDSASLTVVVIQPSPTTGDTQGPTISRWAVSPALIYWDQDDSCTPREVTVNAYYVSDPSGVSGVKVVYRMKGGTWQSKGMTQMQTGLYSATIGPNDLELSLNPPVTYQQEINSLECYVQAIDSVGNRTDSDVRTVTVEYRSCVVR